MLIKQKLVFNCKYFAEKPIKQIITVIETSFGLISLQNDEIIIVFKFDYVTYSTQTWLLYYIEML